MAETTVQASASPLIEIVVDYYDAHHKTKLSKHSNAARIASLVAEGLKIGEAEFVTYAMFTQQKDHDGYRTYQELKTIFPEELPGFRRHFDLAAGTLRARFGGDDMQKHQTERAGVAGALLVMNRIFDLHEADWHKIPESGLKDLDFLLASTGSGYIEVEAKGSVVQSAQMRAEVSHAKGEIGEKKAAQRADGNKNDLFGVITAIPTSANEKARCWLLDPPAQPVDMPPAKYKILARLNYYLESIARFSQMRMLIALSNRIATLRRLDNYIALDELPLVDSRGEPFRFHPSLEQYKTMLLKDKVVGRAFPISGTEFFFYGFDVAIFDLLTVQNFESIGHFRSTIEGNHDLDFVVVLDGNDLKRFEISPERNGYEPYDKSQRWWVAHMQGRLAVTGSGRATAILHDNASDDGGLAAALAIAATTPQSLTPPLMLGQGQAPLETLWAPSRARVPIPTLG
jgi:hypothetical protein